MARHVWSTLHARHRRALLADGGVALLIALLAAVVLPTLYGLPGFIHVPPSAALPLVGWAGFYQTETVFSPQTRYRWSEPNAVVSLPYPDGQLQLTLTLARVNPPSVPVQLHVGAMPFQFTVESAPRHYHLLIPNAPRLATRLYLELASPKLAETTNGEQRELGLLVGDIAIQGLARANPVLVCLFALVTVGSYAALRGSGVQRGPALMITLLALALAAWIRLVCFWQFRFALLSGTVLLASCVVVPCIEQHIGWRPPTPKAERPTACRQAVALLCALTLGVRLALVPLPEVVGDHTTFAVWGDWLLNHGLHQFYTGLIEYPPLWPYMLWGLMGVASWLNSPFALPLPLPLGTMLLLKLPAIFADLLMVLIIYRTALRWRSPAGAWWIAAGWSLLPVVWLNSAWWGQVDVLPTLMIVFALIFWNKANGTWSWAFFAIGLLIKVQMIVFLPLIGVATLRNRGVRGVALGSVTALLVAGALCTPLLAVGQATKLLGVYTSSVGHYSLIGLNVYNLWYLLTWGRGINDYFHSQPGWNDTDIWVGGVTYHSAGLFFMGALVLWGCFILARRSTAETRLMVAVLLALGFYVLPTQIHERYLFPVFPLLGLWAARDNGARVILLLVAITGSINLLRGVPLIPALFAVLSPQAIPLVVSACNVALLGLLVLRSYHALQTAEHTGIA